MTAIAREQKLQKELESIKRIAEYHEQEQYKIGTEEARKVATSFALIAMGAGAILEEVNEARECERTGKLPSYCI